MAHTHLGLALTMAPTATAASTLLPPSDTRPVLTRRAAPPKDGRRFRFRFRFSAVDADTLRCLASRCLCSWAAARARRELAALEEEVAPPAEEAEETEEAAPPALGFAAVLL